MPRKSEIMQMDIQREFCNTMQNLREIWDEIGIPDNQIESRGNTVLMHIRNMLSEMVSEENNLKEAMLTKIRTYCKDLKNLCAQLKLPPCEEPSDFTIMQREKYLRTQVSRLNKMKEDRVCTLATLKSLEQELCDQLRTTPCYIPSGTIPSEEQLDQLRDHIDTLKTEKSQRKQAFSSKRSEVICLYDELELEPESSFAQDVVTDDLDSFCLSNEKMGELEELRLKLNCHKTKASDTTNRLWSRIGQLWNQLEVPMAEQNEVRSKYFGIKPAHIAGIEQTLANLEERKRASLQRLTERARSRLAVLWDKCFYSADQRQQFVPAYDENYSEDLLTEHDEELTKLEAYYRDHRDMFTNVEKWQKLFRRMLELEDKAHDPNRFSNRGGNLLQEEKERKKIHRQLPKIEQDLFSAIEAWENVRGEPFLVEGIRFADFVHSQWEACERRKESEKLQRMEKKKEETKAEAMYGSTPKTPTKRRFLCSTSTVHQTTTAGSAAAAAAQQKAPTPGKKPRNRLESSWRTNTALLPLTPSNRNTTTGASAAVAHATSPGKPPISTRMRLCSGGSQQKSAGKGKPAAAAAAGRGKSLAHKQLEMNGDAAPTSRAKSPASVRSDPTPLQIVSILGSPDPNSTFARNFSQTIISSEPSSSVRAAPMPEVGGTTYAEFTNAINTNARDAKVRSSAIGDFAARF